MTVYSSTFFKEAIAPDHLSRERQLETPDMRSYITSSLKKMTGRTVDVTVENDKNLLGGIVIGVGDTLYDGSIKNQLNNMRNLLGEAR